MLKFDLTSSYPRSVRDKVLGVVQLGRAIDKGIATANGTNGEYHYNCPMDKDVFAFLNIDADALMDVLKKAQSQDEIVAYVKPYVEKKSAAEIEAFNAEFLTHGPNDATKQYFADTLKAVAPHRTDITTWADLLDLDEKRTVPERVLV
jgi:hypothetical protein